MKQFFTFCAVLLVLLMHLEYSRSITESIYWNRVYDSYYIHQNLSKRDLKDLKLIKEIRLYSGKRVLLDIEQESYQVIGL